MALEIKGDSTQSVKKSKKSTKKSMNRVHFILDESGSMSHARQSTIDGFNEYVNGLRNDKNGNSYKISLTKFEGGNVVRVFTDLNIKQVRDLGWEDYCPCGGTNLNDAIGYTMQDMDKNKLKHRGKYNTLVIILTDGAENQSREWTQSMVAELIKEKEKDDGWTVTFLGANIDTQRVSRGYAISIDNARSYTTKGMRSTMANLSTATAAYASTATVGASMCNMLSESASGISADSWMAEDDNSASDLSGVDTVTGLCALQNPPRDNLVNSVDQMVKTDTLVAEDARDMGLGYNRATGEFTSAAGEVLNKTRTYGALDPKLLKQKQDELDAADKKSRGEDNG